MKIIIPGTLTTLNRYIQAERSHRQGGARIKKENTEKVMRAVKMDYIGFTPVPFKTPVIISIAWYRPDRRSDPDNVAFAKKFILDALVKRGVLKDDSWKCIVGFVDIFFVDKKSPRVIVNIDEVSGSTKQTKKGETTNGEAVHPHRVL